MTIWQRQPGLASSQRGRGQAEDGSVSPMLVVLVLALLIAVGLVVDGGTKLRLVQATRSGAAEAARAAAQAVQPAGTVRGAAPAPAPAAAVRAGQQFLRAAGLTGTVTVTGSRLQVSATAQFTPVFLALIGLGRQTVVGHAEARLTRRLGQEPSP